MTNPASMDAKRFRASKIDWDEVRRRQERTRYLIERMWEVHRRLERAVDRLIRPQ
jgi:hypothetical protein